MIEDLECLCNNLNDEAFVRIALNKCIKICGDELIKELDEELNSSRKEFKRKRK